MSVTHSSSVSSFNFFFMLRIDCRRNSRLLSETHLFMDIFFPDFSMESCLLCSSNAVFLHGSHCLLLCYLGLLLVSMI